MKSLPRWAACGLAAAALAVHAAAPLPALNVDRTQISVSGLSSGGFLANQLGYAYAGTFMGVGVFAGGPYMCAGHALYPACMYDSSIGAARLGTMQSDLERWSGGANDALSGVARQKVYLWVGGADTTVGPNPMAAVKAQYERNGVPAANLSWNELPGAGHTFPTDFAGRGDSPCAGTSPPYVSNCGYDGAGAMFRQIYGALHPRNDAPPDGNYRRFDQARYTAGNPGMASTGWLYVPASCAAGAACRLHVALHGCLQSESQVGRDFVRNTGYTRWADTNDIIVLFPQTRVDDSWHLTADSGGLPNPNACWDWIGWYGADFARRDGAQMKAIKAMVDALAAGGAAAASSVLPAPAGLVASDPTTGSMTLRWDALPGASGYNVYRDGTRVNASAVTGTSYVDAGLAAGTRHAWTVTGVAESAPSAAVSGTTAGVEAATCHTASNVAHVLAGRAHVLAGHAFANGSDQDLGFWNLFVVTTLQQRGPGDYVMGTCP